MDVPSQGATRVARAAAFGVATLALAAGAHVAAGGGLPSMTILAMLAVPVSLAAVALTGRRCGPVLLLGSMATAQVLLNKMLKALTVQVPDDMADQLSDAPILGLVVQTMAGADGSVAMTATHVVATVVTALLLAHAEQALWQLVCRLLPALPSEPVVVGRRSLWTPAFISLPASVPSVVSGGLGLRGPPARCVAA